VIRTSRILCRLVRKTIKPLRLAINAWQFKKTQEEIEYFASFRALLVEKEREQHLRQVQLQMQRNRIAGW